MKIGADITPLIDKEYSGVSWYTLDLLTEILRQDKINDYFLYYNSAHNISGRLAETGLEKNSAAGKVKIITTRFPNKLFNYFLQLFFHWPKLDKLIGGADIFWSPHLGFSSFSKNCRKILTIHDLSFLIFPSFFSWRKIIWHKLLKIEKKISSADKIIAISENTKNDLIKFFGVKAEKISVIYSGSSDEFRPLDLSGEKFKKIKEKYALPDKFILNIGTIEPRKNIVGLVMAFDKIASLPEFKDYHLIIAGGAGWKNKKIFKAIKAAENKDKIKIIGYIEKSERAYFYNLAAIFCYPSFYEGFGLPVLEAMACGTPVITSAVSALPEVAGDAALYIDPNNIETISEALKKLAGSGSLRAALKQAGLEQAKKFSWKKTAEEYIKIFVYEK